MTPELPQRHATWTELADLADGRAGASERIPLETHLAACPQCAGRLGALTQITDLMRTDRSPEPPAHVTARAVRLFQAETPVARARAWLGRVAPVMGQLVFDSFAQPSFASARGGMTGRRLRFEAAGLELDLMIERRAGKGMLTGQMLRIDEDATPLAGARFLLLAGGRPAAEGTTDEGGEFSAHVEQLNGTLLVVIDEGHPVSFFLPSDLDA